MALMATCEVFEKEDLAGKVIPAMSICLVDREKCVLARHKVARLSGPWTTLLIFSMLLPPSHRTVRDQAYRAIDMFVKKCEALTASMVRPHPLPRLETSFPPQKKKEPCSRSLTTLPRVQPDTVIPDTPTGQSPALQAAAQTQPGLATNAAGAAGALAGWAFASVSKKVSPASITQRREAPQLKTWKLLHIAALFGRIGCSDREAGTVAFGVAARHARD